MKRIVNALSKASCEAACAVLVLCLATEIALSAQTFTTLSSFDSTTGIAPNEGLDGPNGGLIQASDGNLYGVTYNGGAGSFCPGTYDYYGPGCGTIFKIASSGAISAFYNFCSQSGCTDGGGPNSILQGTDGNFYGTTSYGGANGYGTVFKITPSGLCTTLHSFINLFISEGYGAQGLIQAADGDFYGATFSGGPNNNSPYCFAGGCGTIFKVTPSGALTTLYAFCSQDNCEDGAFPVGTLVEGFDGNFYGTTEGGGPLVQGQDGEGSVFKITPSGTLTTLHTFCAEPNCTDGEKPYAGLVQAADGDFYGTTKEGGPSHFGTVFKITPSGTLTTLYTFCSQSGCLDGSYPEARLVRATNGNFYGTTWSGGSLTNPPCGSVGCGTIFEITPSGSLTTLHSFCVQANCPDGDGPIGPIQATNGVLYGTTTLGGANSDGTAFSLSLGLLPFIETQRTFGVVGQVVSILGTDLTGATSVSFSGTPAVFDVVSRSYIVTKVPSGATTGRVSVVTPRGTLASNVPFQVLP